MVRAIGGVTVHSRFSFSDPVRPQGYHRGTNRLNPFQALIFGRVRHPLPRGDFDRSANQQELLRSILRRVRAHEQQPGFMERGVMASVKYMDTDLAPSELYRLAQAVTGIQPGEAQGLRRAGPHRRRRGSERGVREPGAGPSARQRRPQGRDAEPRLLRNPVG